MLVYQNNVGSAVGNDRNLVHMIINWMPTYGS
jgi:hypothetical protein